ncbi:MAG TPA: hypothetical protein VJU61_15285, partial [Polyangiaceae bacterium]|nr:hypothetical protein [Polyangiaceae bacterium]
SERAAPRFRLVVTGSGSAGDGPSRSVRQVAIVGFQPGLTVRLTVYLAQVCLQSACDAAPDQTCSPITTATTAAGACGSIKPQDDLVAVTPGMEAADIDWGALAGPHSTATSPALDGATQSCNPAGCDASAPSTGGQGTDAAVQAGTDAGVTGPGNLMEEAGREAGVAPDAGRDAGSTPDASSTPDAGSDGGVDAGNVRNCLNGITGYDRQGPFSFTTQTIGAVKFWLPGVPAGCRVPVVHFANGTGASCSVYQAIIERLASHGFLAACEEATNTGSGAGGMAALETAITMFSDLADNKLGTLGHNQGGQAAFATISLAERKWGASMIMAGLAMQPTNGFGSQPVGMTWQATYATIRAPMFMFSGTADTLVSAGWVMQGFNALPEANEAYFWSAIGATHNPVPVGPTQQVAVPWFRWKLLRDKDACVYFKALPGAGSWEKTASKNEQACQ